MPGRAELLADVATHLLRRSPGHPLRVGVDGVVGAGKSTFARELVEELATMGAPAVYLDSDGFHNARAVRYRQGRDSARGYYEDAYDFEALAERVLRPLGPRGSFVYATKVRDLASDHVVADAVATAEANGVVVFDCTFLQRGAGLRELWDEVVWLEAERTAALRRGVERDVASLGGEAAAISAYESRYMAACDIYLAEEAPEQRASIVIEHTAPAFPRLVRAS